ncbi:MAG TPA: serine/threonine-protein kinase, partial [Sandaracinaceae bacterium LLY-WYZ-13_1]|nr:serine/threonine-protein kinase [Sandaracinaceae bacterium LLY-WYZ-13_1]
MARSLVGRELDGRYRVTGRIAHGGMGDIYEARHLALGRAVAVKVLAPAYARDEEALQRFAREAEATARLHHPNIVGILDVGRLDDGSPYLVMERLEGEDLADRIEREAPLPPRRVAELLAPVARALDAVHAQGLLHRDIKPENVFLARDAEGTVTPKLLDFGLAALREAPGRERLTRADVVVGTPHYVSPEAAQGDPLDERGDVYALGVIAYELLCGVLPFEGERPMALLVRKVRRPAPSLARRTGRRFDARLEALLARCLSRTPARRPASCGAFVRALAEIAASLPPDAATCVDLPHTEPRPRSAPSGEAVGGAPPASDAPERRASDAAASRARRSDAGAGAQPPGRHGDRVSLPGAWRIGGRATFPLASLAAILAVTAGALWLADGSERGWLGALATGGGEGRSERVRPRGPATARAPGPGAVRTRDDGDVAAREPGGAATPARHDGDATAASGP